jgi:hypothetical protein
VANLMRELRRLGSRRWAVAGFVAAVSVAVLSASATMAEPKKALAAADLRGCCVCRGTDGGSATSVRSCSDGASVDACVSQCKGINADSLAFGHNQTCSQGCAGFPTQGLH